MTRSIRPSFKTTLASLLLDDIQLNRNSYYYFLGRTEPWGTIDVPPQNIPNASEVELSARNSATFFKRIDKNDVSLVIPRKDWISGEIVSQWDSTLDMSGVPFYRVVDQTDVYLCLDNAENSIQTIKPSGQSITPIRLSDGYLWKFVYTVPASKRRSFMNAQYIPIQRAISDGFYSNGSIDAVNVLSGGTDYATGTNTFIDVLDTAPGTTSGTGAIYIVSAIDTIGAITAVTKSYGGQNYVAGCVMRANIDVQGTGAVLTPIFASDSVDSVSISSGGTGYKIGDVFTGVVGGAEIVPVVQDLGKIIGTKIVNAGTGYIQAPTLTVRYTGTQTLGIPTGEYSGNQTAILKSIVSNGRIVKVLIEDAGVNYPHLLATQIIVQGDGIGARFKPVIVDGTVTDVVTENPGAGYTLAAITVQGAVGTGAKLTAAISQSDFTSAQSAIEQTAIPGGIHSIKLQTKGTTPYSAGVQVHVTGNGVGCTAVAIRDLDGFIDRVVVTSPGSNYYTAQITFSDSVGVGATAYAIMQPAGGHGYDIVSQIGQTALALSQQLSTETSLIDMQKQFRQFGIIRNPRSVADATIFRGIRDTAVYDITYSQTQSKQLDIGDIIENAQTKYLVLRAGETTATLQPITSIVESPFGVLTNSSDDSMTYTCTEVIQQPTVDKYTGSILYLGDELPFSFFADQGLSIKTFLKF